MDYRIGLDIGVASVGFAVMETDKDGEPVRIKDLGVRVFEKAEQPKGASLAEPRRNARGLRRRLRRKAHRRERTEILLQELFGKEILEKIKENDYDIFELRYKGISQVLSPEDLGKVLLYFVKHRGFLSNRKSDADDKEGGLLLKATSENSKYLAEKGYKTVGQMLYEDEKYFSYVEKKKEKDGKDKEKIYFVRNKQGSYDHTFLRSDLKNEIQVILEKQKEGGKVTDDFIEKYIYIFWTNRNFDEGPGKPSQYRGGYAIGKCPFEKEELRAPKFSYTFEYTNALMKLNNLKILADGNSRFLTEDEREKVINKIKKSSKIDFAALKKLLSLDENTTFNLVTYSPKKAPDEIEKKTTFVSLANSYKVRKCLDEQNAADSDVLDKIALILSLYKSDERRLEKLAEIKTLSDKEKDELLSINAKSFGGTSIKFLKNIQPYLEQGLKYNDACARSGYNHSEQFTGNRSKFLDTKEVYEQVQDIAVPVVKRAVSQTIKILNAIIRKYGSPIAINVELARELSKNFSERQKILKNNEERAKDNEKIVEILKNEHNLLSPSGQDVLKFRLYEEQGGKCAYSGESFEISKLFESNYAQIDHIIPYSRSFDDSMNNKVLVFTKENQDKKNRLPYEYFGNDAEKWKKFENYVQSQYKTNRAKTERLLKKKFTEEDSNDWKERNLNDTKYISRFVYNLLKDNLLFADSKLKKKVYAVNGRITAYMRKMWGLNKVREEGDRHHALDASVIACVTDGEIRNITEFNKGKEYVFKASGHYVNVDGEIITEEQYDAEFGKKLKPPYELFAKELTYRLSNDPKYYQDFFVKQDYTDEELDNLAPVFVSRMVNKKKKGQIHDATIKSARNFDKGETVSRVPLSKLKLGKDAQGNYCIKDYYRPQDDLLLYNKLLSLLVESDNKPEVAFKDKIYKPKSDGTDGALVKKVKITEKATSGFVLDKVKGVAGNGDMIRIDVFTKNNKYYAVPVYVKDAYAGVLPNKAVVANKSYDKWLEMDETFEFLFSLYKNDLVYIEHKNVLKLTKTNSDNKNDTRDFHKGYLYYNSFNISSGGATLFNIDSSYEIGGCGIKTLVKFEKCQADYFGNIRFVKNEKREGF